MESNGQNELTSKILTDLERLGYQLSRMGKGWGGSGRIEQKRRKREREKTHGHGRWERVWGISGDGRRPDLGGEHTTQVM